MNRDFIYHIEENFTGQKISDFLKVKGFSEQNLVDLRKDEDALWVNGEPVHQNAVLSTGDELKVCLHETKWSEQITPVDLPLDILYEDEDLLIINKPAGMPINPSFHNPDNSLGNALMYYYRQQNLPFVYRCVNRLDRDTSGLTIVAKHSVSSAMLSDMVRNRAIKREYIAVVEGIVKEDEGTISAPIRRLTPDTIERIVDEEQGERAVTHYRVLSRVQVKENSDKQTTLSEEKASIQPNAYSVVLCTLETGKTHQIRVHMTHIEHPLLGDFLYYPEDHTLSRQALHAWRLTFVHPITGEEMQFEAPVPNDIRNLPEFPQELFD